MKHTPLHTLTAACCALLLIVTTPASAQVAAKGTRTGTSENLLAHSSRTAIDITIPTPLMNKLIAQFAARQQQDVANKIHVELWSVTYQPSPKDPSTIEILLQQRMNPDISIANSNDGVAYSMSNPPAGNNLIVLAYCSLPAGATDMKIVGRPYYSSQGAGNGFQHKKFVSNVKKVVNNPSIAFGIYSLNGPGSVSSLNFKASSAMATGGAQTMDFMDNVVGDVGEALSGVADAATSAVTGIQSWLQDLGNNYINLFNQLMALAPAQGPDFYNFLIKNANDISTIIAHAPAALFDNVVVGTWKALGNGLIAITLDGMNYVLYGTTAPHQRRISQYEYDWANAYIFNGSLPPISRLYITNLMTTDHRFVTLPVGDGTIDLNLGDAYNDPISAIRTAYPYIGQVLIHELSHAWQIGKKGVVPTVTQGIWNTFLGLAGKDRYNYYPNCKDNWNNYNLEQQASIIDAGYCQVYDNGSYFPNSKGACGTEQGYIISEVRAGVPLDKTAADNLFYSFQSNKYILDNTRDPNTGAAGPNGIMIPSNGNRRDGAGYFMAGHKAGSIFYYSINAKVATVNWGPIRDRYAAATSQYSNGMFGAEHGYLGWPLNNITPLNGGMFQHFQHGSIYWTPQFGAFVVEGRVLDTWAKSNWEKGPLGYPVSDFIANDAGPNTKSALSGSGYQKFEKGIIQCGGIIDPSPPEIVLNSQLIKGGTIREQMGNSNPPKSKNPPGNSVKPAPGIANAINPQPLPPKEKKTGN